MEEMFCEMQASGEYRLCPTFKACLSRKHVFNVKGYKASCEQRLKLAQTTNNLTYLSLPCDQPTKIKH